MELIKKIKQAEEQGKGIVEQAKAYAAYQSEKVREEREESLSEAEKDRKKAISEAGEKAESEGLVEVENLKKQAQSAREELRKQSVLETSKAVAKVMDYLRG